MPVETLVHHNQALYYKALQDSHAGAVDCRPFIDFMLDAIANSLYKYIDVATESRETIREDVGVNVGVCGRILEWLARQPHLSARELATLLNKTTRTVERHLKTLRQQGRLKRVGSDKAGHWEVIEGSQ